MMDKAEYKQRLGEKRASRLNEVIRAVNVKVPKAKLALDEVEQMFYGKLVDEAEQIRQKYGLWPTFELCEIDYDDPILDIYGDDA